MFRSSSCLLAFASIALAGCVTASQPGGSTTAALPSPERPGTTVRVRNPDPGKWAAVPPTEQMRNSKTSGWVCRPMACAGRAVMVSQLGGSPTRNPDRTALEKAAKLLATQTKAQDLMMEAASEGDERITPISNRPAVSS